MRKEDHVKAIGRIKVELFFMLCDTARVLCNALPSNVV